MTAFGTNLIMIIMASVWAYLSVITKSIYPVPFEFLAIGAALAGPEVVKAYKLWKGLI